MSQVEKGAKNFAKYSAIITGILVFSKFTGFFREWIVAYRFGATIDSDIFKAASTMPQLLFSAVSAALVTTFIPIFSSVKDDREEASRLFRNIFNTITIICIVLSILGIVISPVLVRLSAGGFEGEVYERTVRMTQILMPSMIFLGMSGLYTGYLQSYKSFIQPALTGIAANAVVIIGILVFYQYGITAAVVSVMISSAAQAFMQRPYMKGYKYKFYLDFKSPHLRKMLILAVPIIISSVVSQINLMVARNFASHLAEGSISVIDYAQKFSTLINQVFIVSITTVVYPSLTEKFAKNDMEGFKELIIKSVNLVLLVAVPLILGMASVSFPLIKLVFEHGKFDASATQATATCLQYLAFGALGYSITDILGKVFFASKDTVTPMINGFINVVLNITFIFLLVPRFGVQGLALATTLSTMLVAVILFFELKRKIKDIHYNKIFISFSKIAISGVVMAVLVYFSFKYSSLVFSAENNLNLAIRMGIAVLVGAVSYTAMLIVLKVEELQGLRAMVFKRRKVK